MNPKLYLLAVTLLVFGLTSNAQLKVWPDGHTSVINLVGTGTTTFAGVNCTGMVTANTMVVGASSSTTGYQLHVNGSAGLIVTSGSTSYFRFTSNYYHGIIGSSSDKIYFWTNPSLEFNKVWFQNYTSISDSTMKTQIQPLDSSLQIVMELNPVQYRLKADSLDPNGQLGYGFIAQEMQQIIPDIVDTAMGVMGIRTAEIIPFLVVAIQTQQAQIDSLTAEIDSLNERMIIQEQCDCKIKNKSSEINSSGSQTGSTITPENSYIELGQNNPNPFKESTTINYVLPESTKSAQIIVYDLQGKELETYSITRFGEGNIIVDGSTFKPGMYVYALIVDGNYIDSKKMILTK